MEFFMASSIKYLDLVKQKNCAISQVVGSKTLVS